MEALEKALLRDRQKLSHKILDPVEVHTLSDIKHIISAFDPNKNPQQSNIQLNTVLEEVLDGKKVAYKVSADTRSKSKRDMLIEGLKLIEHRSEVVGEIETSGEYVEVNGKSMKPAILLDSVDGHNWVDPLIKQWTGGIRRGTIITWNIGDGYEYQYNIFKHELVRIELEE